MGRGRGLQHRKGMGGGGGGAACPAACNHLTFQQWASGIIALGKSPECRQIADSVSLNVQNFFLSLLLLIRSILSLSHALKKKQCGHHWNGT